MNTGPLEIGLWLPLQIREERLRNHLDACRILYVSDIHLRRNRSQNLMSQVLNSVQQSTPDVVLLGDLVDRATDLDALSELVGSIARIAPVLAVGGNHDQHVGLELVRDAVVLGGGKWIHSVSEAITHRGRTIQMTGPDSTGGLLSDAHVRILCGHNPRIWKSARRAGYDLVLAGHLHGCQLVAFEFRDRLYPGAVFYPYCYLTHRSGSTTLVVSRGVSDLFPVRWRCPREVVLCYV